MSNWINTIVVKKMYRIRSLKVLEVKVFFVLVVIKDLFEMVWFGLLRKIKINLLYGNLGKKYK